jgi:hypothetical protein
MLCEGLADGESYTKFYTDVKVFEIESEGGQER